MKILVENSTWNNIGDGFYQSTLYALFTKLFPQEEIYMGEGPFQRAFRPRPKWQLENGFKLMDYQQADIHVFSGPMLRAILPTYSEKIKEIKKRGGNYLLVSVSSAHITEEERVATGKFLEKYPPMILATRDEETYTNFKEFQINVYNGICTAFLVNKMLPVLGFSGHSRFFISSFYNELEPVYKLQSGEVEIENIKVERKATFLGLSHSISRHLNFLRPQQDTLLSHKIVRVHQDLSTHFYHVKFSHPNSFMSFNPLSYLSLYKSADFTISDRVHSCAVALSFGKPAMLFTNSPRAGIFDRLGYKIDRNSRIIYPIDNGIINREVANLSKAIEASVNCIA
ncbi:polysaccharide pyruvyl transferase family protein [Telluribacter sp. SYSU D00476]|uniref:polysaccharide pyruvyl transferase family protein n=1 Tax=Telluribacter sp. SYSU D00476 TaxID=2811430 RepID=UPI001FF42F78|nr:polysaccharide pyruvyl transferase family protein [Telluribacter sp. SYSU D00476]